MANVFSESSFLSNDTVFISHYSCEGQYDDGGLKQVQCNLPPQLNIYTLSTKQKYKTKREEVR